jgi:hypothetical protein
MGPGHPGRKGEPSMICAFCQQEFIPITSSRATMCSDRCRVGKNLQDAKERYRKIRRGELAAPETWKAISKGSRKIPVQVKNSHRPDYMLERVRGPLYDQMMDNLHRFLMSTEDEVSLIFGQAQSLGRGANTIHVAS